ncbi:hypothetical protein K3495_g672 [Podosphaera aphanis]|nr:hypothetical protein K3495_g672 [Podosphaera aphanis]
MNQTQPVTSSPVSNRLNRDQPLQIKTLHESGMNQTTIADQFGVTRRQVRYTLSVPYLEPKKALGRLPALSYEDVDKIEDFLTASPEGRRMSSLELASGPFQNLGVSEFMIQNELKKRGYGRGPSFKKPFLSEVNKRKCLEWAEAHKDWTGGDWMNILWTDGTWVTGGRHKRDWVTRKIGEEVDINCVTEKLRKDLGWMFWGCIAGTEQGASLFWEKEWGTITSDTYSQRIVPLIHGMVSMKSQLSVMQDNAPAHASAATMNELRERSITTINWPPFSPDLNPIEHVWGGMKDYIQYHYPRLDGGRQRSHDELRDTVKEAWDDATKPEKLEKLIRSMHRRSEAVIRARGRPTKF